ncbi:MAG: hypothetical protein FJ100_03390 [Deltaproteobacteria bacterium]|nr:hypothetical protein [Deltaproteobacteria bacterium]
MNKALAAMFLLAAMAACTSSSGTGGTGGTTGGGDAITGADGSAATDGADTTAGGGDTTGGADTTAGGDTAVVADATAADTAANPGGTWANAEPAMKGKCATCHNANAKLFFQADNCASSATKSPAIKSQIEAGKMPQKGMPPLTADEKKAIFDWVAAGAKCP